MPEPAARTAHRDTFVRDHLPHRDLWPKLEYTLPELHYPKQLNCAVELLDHNVERGAGADVAFRYPGGHVTYGELLERTNSIANMLVGSFGLVPGQRVLLRAPNNVMLVACWLVETGVSLMERMISPFFRPAFSAGRLGRTISIRAGPLGL